MTRVRIAAAGRLVGLGLDGQRVEPPRAQQLFPCPAVVRPARGFQMNAVQARVGHDRAQQGSRVTIVADLPQLES